MALIKCKECGKEISDKAVACPNCGYPLKHPVPNYADIKLGYDIYLNDTYYDEKNNRYISEFEYLEAKERAEKEFMQAYEEGYTRKKKKYNLLKIEQWYIAYSN